jgi:hypothetical protein
VSTYGDLVNEHLRITILLLLKDQNDYALNESLLLDLVGNFGFAPSRDKLRTQLSWLAEQDLIKLSGVPHCQVATLTARGDDVAHGRTTVPGVKRPRPGERS